MIKAMLLRSCALAVLLALVIVVSTLTSAAASRPLLEGPTIHIVQTGETLASIAARYGTTVSALLQLNSLRNPNLIYVGQRLLVSRADAGGSAGGASGGGGVHVVRRGQTLGSIARQYGLGVEALRAANGLRGDLIFVGQRLRIPSGAGAPAAGTGQYHVVQAGETLGAIAKRYGMTAEQLAQLNGIRNASLIKVGQKLLVAGSAQPAARGPKKIVVDISEQRCWRYEGDTLLNTWRCSTGRNNSTATGNFRVQSKLRKAYGSTWGIWMPYWLGIYWAGPTENGIHGLPWDAKSGARTWAGLVGVPITYGCVMLTDAVMKEVWEWADIGTRVVIKR